MPIEMREVHDKLLRSLVEKKTTAQAKRDALNERLIPAYDAYRGQMEAARAQQDEKVFLEQSVQAINTYKDLIDGPDFTLPKRPTRFSPQGKLHSTVMEEFWALVLRALLERSSHQLPERTTV